MESNVLSLWLTCVCLTQSSGMLSHVDTYEVVRPHRLLGRPRRTLGDQQLYPDTMRYALPVEGINLTIHLEKNRDLFGVGYTETHYTEDGRRVTSSPEEEHCYYHGYIEGMKDSSVSVGLCSGISGFLQTRKQVYLIKPLGGSDDGEHAIFRREQLKVNGTPSCGSITSYDGDRGPKLASLFSSRAWKSKPSTGEQRFVELFVVVDNTEYNRYGDQTKARILGAINHIDKLYRTLNIRVVLVGLEIWTYKDCFEVDSNSETTLDRFLLWHQNVLPQRTKHDNAQFVTGKDFDGDTVGLANKFAMCTENSGGVNQDHHDNPIGLASTIAHEMGHNFGMSHDAPGCVCGLTQRRPNCVMADKLSTGNLAFPEFFSDCSVEQLADFMTRAQLSCLSRPPSSVETIIVAPLCGNHLLDGGEECDCGTVQECDNPCCDPSTCRLTQGSQCSDGPCCENCQLKQAGSICRAPAGECDLAEYCTGASEECPEDSFEMNGKPCYNQAAGYCHDGQCPTHEHHCWRLFGPGTVVGPDLCFDLNKQGEKGASCGRSKYGYTRCTPQNLKCGSIFCGGGGDSITGKRTDYTVFGIVCKVAVDDDKTRNINMVPNGARCGPNKVCLDNRCVDVSVYGVKEDCAKKCNNNGVCNHKKECHCSPGWAPPYCNVQYAELPHVQTGVIVAACTVPLILLLISGGIVWKMCCKRAKKDTYNAKRKVHSAPNKLNTIFQQPDPKDRPQISDPTLMETTATQATTPLMLTPSRPPPQPPKKFSTPPATSHTEVTKAQPPSKPLPPLSQTQFTAVKLTPPPLPSVKPSPTLAARITPRTLPQPPNRPKTKPPPHRRDSSDGLV